MEVRQFRVWGLGSGYRCGDWALGFETGIAEFGICFRIAASGVREVRTAQGSGSSRAATTCRHLHWVLLNGDLIIPRAC